MKLRDQEHRVGPGGDHETTRESRARSSRLLSVYPEHDPGDEDRSVSCYCRNCGDPFDIAAQDAALGIPSAWRPCPAPSPGRPMVDCGVGGHTYVEREERCS